MKILLLGINSRYTHSNLALYYLRNSLLDSNHDCEILETSINSDLLDTIQQVNLIKPDVLCLSVYIWNTDYTLHLLPLLKNVMPGLVIVAGGPEVTYPNQYIEQVFSHIDYAVQGAGEEALAFLAEKSFVHDEKFVNIPNKPFKDIPFPYLQSDKILLENKYLYYEASRGCPFKCSFCLSSRSDIILEYRDIATVKDELKQLIGFNPRLVKFIDRSFNADRKFAYSVWEYLIELNPKITFHFEIKPDLLKDEDLELLKSAPLGLFQFEIGLQSTNPETLSAIDRYVEFDKIKPYLVKVNQLDNIHTHLDLISGLPHEDLTSFSNSFNMAIKTYPRYLQLGFLKVLPGTKIAEQAEDFEIKSMPYPPYQIIQNKWLSFTDLMDLDRFTHYFDLFYNSEKMTSTLHYIVGKVDNPFDFFSSLFTFCKDNGFESKKDYYIAFKLMADYIKSEYDELSDYVMESLYYDWCNNVCNPKVPTILVSDDSVAYKSETFSTLRNVDKELPEVLQNAKKYLKKALFARFKNAEFVENKLNGKTQLITYREEGIQRVLY